MALFIFRDPLIVLFCDSKYNLLVFRLFLFRLIHLIKGESFSWR